MHRSQLEVLRSSENGEERGSLLWLLDHTVTPMGGRLLRHWVAHPLRHEPTITARLDAVQELAAAGDCLRVTAAMFSLCRRPFVCACGRVVFDAQLCVVCLWEYL